MNIQCSDPSANCIVNPDGESLLLTMSTSLLEPTIPTDHGHKASLDSWMTFNDEETSGVAKLCPDYLKSNQGMFMKFK